jgi:hypothetical protein
LLKKRSISFISASARVMSASRPAVKMNLNMNFDMNFKGCPESINTRVNLRAESTLASD